MKVPRVIIVGAGMAGRALAREYAEKPNKGQVIAFLDDDPKKIGTKAEGIDVLGPIDSMADWLEAELAVIAIPSATKGQLREIVQSLKRNFNLSIRILPSLNQIIDGEAHLALTRELDPQDLLGRNPVRINLKQSLAYLRGKRVLITGAGGSIGSELARQLLSGGAERLYLLGHGENSIYNIEKELRELQKEGVGEKAIVVPIIGDLRDKEWINFLLGRLKAHIIFHAAAHKHVPMMEHNPVECVINNVWSTIHLVEAAKKYHVQRFVLISTDKAVSPTSIYGATKKIAEEVVLSANQTDSASLFMVVRFGNVLGSRGSILPLFKQQILAGGPITITHPEAKRYFMTIPEAASLVLQTGGVGAGGQLYLLDMGEPISICELARQMTQFYNKTPERDIPIEYIGLREGEKLIEKLWEDWEDVVPTEFPRINRIVRRRNPVGLEEFLETVKAICFFDPLNPKMYRNRAMLRQALRIYIPSVEDKHEPEY
jgi:FlaA1/EpsC-like NDP-sugar epimerase